MKAVSAFSGVGGFELGLAYAGIKTLASIEIDKAAQGVIRDRVPGTHIFDDIQEVTGEQLRATGFQSVGGILTGGFPCQDLSVAGRRAGLSGARSGLFYEFARLLEETQSEWFILENVPGLLSSNGGRDMGAILGTLADCGYSTAWRVLDSQFFGVPQRRRRVFIVGHLGEGASPAEILLEPEGGAGNLAPSSDKEKVVAALTSNGVGTCGADDNQAQAGHLIPATAFHLTQDPISGGVSPALSQGTKQGCSTIGVQQGLSVRRLTPTECERLQGFPDGWTATSNGKEQKDSARYRQLGNAVTVPVVAWIANRIRRQDEHQLHGQEGGCPAVPRQLQVRMQAPRRIVALVPGEE